MIFAHSFVGVLNTYAVLKFSKHRFSQWEYNLIWIVGVTAGVLPDFDVLIVLLNLKLKHRDFLSHSLIPYLIVTLIIFGLALSSRWSAKLRERRELLVVLGTVFMLGTFSHILIDLLSGGLVLLAPFTYARYGIPLMINSHGGIGFIDYVLSIYMVVEILFLASYLYVLRFIKSPLSIYVPLFFVILTAAVLPFF